MNPFLAHLKARVNDWLRSVHNRPPASGETWHRFEAAFRDAHDAELASKLLSRGEDVVARESNCVVALVKGPRGAHDLRSAAALIEKPLVDVGIAPLRAKLYPPAKRGPKLTWHVPSFGANTRATPEERDALANTPARLAQRGSELPVPGVKRVTLTDLPSIAFVPIILWVAMAMNAAVLPVVQVRLSGTSHLVDPIASGFATAAMAVSVWCMLRIYESTRSKAIGSLIAIVFVAVFYGLSLWAARLSPSPRTASSVLSEFGVGTLYVMGVFVVHALLRRARAAGRALLTALTVVAASFGASTWLQHGFNAQFQQGLGYNHPRFDLDLPSLVSVAPFWGVATMFTLVLTIAVFAWIGQSGRLGLVQQIGILLMAPLVTFACSASFSLQLLEAAHRLKSGDATGSGSVASCVRLATGDRFLTSTTWSAPGVLVGAPGGPSAFIQTSPDGMATQSLLTGGFAVQQAPDTACHPESPSR